MMMNTKSYKKTSDTEETSISISVDLSIVINEYNINPNEMTLYIFGVLCVDERSLRLWQHAPLAHCEVMRLP